MIYRLPVSVALNNAVRGARLMSKVNRMLVRTIQSRVLVLAGTQTRGALC